MRATRVVGISLVRAILRLYPARFRDRFGPAVVELFEERYLEARARGPLDASTFVVRSLANLLVCSVIERFLPPSPAVRSARRRGPFPRFSAVRSDVRHGFRTLGKRPGLSAAAVVALALGVGISTTMFSVRHSFLSPLPFEDQDALMHIGVRDVRAGDGNGTVMRAYASEVRAWRQTQRSFEGLGAYSQQRSTLSDETDLPDVVQSAAITHEVFRVARVRPLRGRAFGRPDATERDAPVVIISESLWRTRYGGSLDVIGRSIRLDGRSRIIVGVVPRGLEIPLDVDVWTPLALSSTDAPPVVDGEPLHVHRWLVGVDVFGRLRHGVTRDEAQVEFDQLATRLAAAYPATNADVGVLVQPLMERYGLDADGRLLFTLMFVATMGVLLIACANVANLLLARAIVRSREVAVRAALGASRGRIMSLMLAESAILAAIGTVLGLAIAMAAASGINAALAPFAELPSWFDVTVDGGVFLFVAGIAVLSGLASGLLPAFHASGTDVSAVLKDESRGATGRRVGRLSRLIVVAELTIASTLLIGSAFMVRNGFRVTTFAPPYATAGTMTARLMLPADRYRGPDARARVLRDLEGRLGTHPAVVAASVSSDLPGTGQAGQPYQPEGRVFDRPQDLPLTRSVAVRPSFFPTFDLDVVQGRVYTDADLTAAETVLLVNESFARRAFPDGNALGRLVRLGSLEEGGAWRTIVGILPDMWTPGGFVDQGGRECVFPLLRSSNHVYVAVRGRADAAALIPVIRSEVAALDEDLAPTDFMSMRIVASRHALFYASFGAAFMVSGVVSLFLAVIGLYSVMASAVATRTYEMGVRMALGARARDVVTLVLRQGMVQITMGLALGFGLGVGLARALQSFIASAGGDTVDVQPLDPVVLVVVLSVLAATGMTACLVPARRATRVDPLVACRAD